LNSTTILLIIIHSLIRTDLYSFLIDMPRTSLLDSQQEPFRFKDCLPEGFVVTETIQATADRKTRNAHAFLKREAGSFQDDGSKEIEKLEAIMTFYSCGQLKSAFH
jgi:hypothetical protein